MAAALGLGSHELVSLVGGGGKTTMLFALGSQLAGTTVMTTTTKMGVDRLPDVAVLVDPSDAEVVEALDASSAVLVWGGVSETKATGVDRARAERWFDLADHVIVEADGSRRRPFKAPGPHEPVVARRSTSVVAVLGADALGRVIWDQCHRPMRVAAVAGCSPFERLTPARAATVLAHRDGGRKDVPADAGFTVLVNRVDPGDAEVMAAVDELARHLADGAVPMVAVRTNGDGQ